MTDKKESGAKKEEEEVEKADASPKWAIELGAKVDKMTDAFTRFVDATVKKQEDEEEKPEDEEKQEDEEEKPKEEDKKKQDEEEEKPEDEEKQEDEEEKPKDEEKVSKEDIAKMVEEGIKKALTIEPGKKSKVPKEVDDVLTYKKIAKMSWAEINKVAQKRGAP